MAVLNLDLLGGFRLCVGGDGETVPLAAKKAQALLAYLALRQGERFSRDRLAALLWEDRAEPQARQSLRQVLTDLRQALPRNKPVLLTEIDAVGLATDALAVDVHDFERRIEAGTPGDLAGACELYRGEFLEGFNPRAPAFEDWLMAQRSRLREHALAAMQQLLEHELASGATERAIRLGLRLLALDPLRESAQRILMELYARQRHYGAAVRQFRICQRVVHRELAIAPEQATVDLYRRLVLQRQRACTEPEVTCAQPVPPTVAEKPSSSVPELRQATVMTAGFAADENDPETRHAQLQHCHATVIERLHDYGGQPVYRLSDGLLAVFGLPAAHSNDAERAVRAAAAIRDALPGSRFGIASGRVLATNGASPTLSGAAVDRANALAVLAQPGTSCSDHRCMPASPAASMPNRCRLTARPSGVCAV